MDVHALIYIVGCICFFIFGMKQMSDGIQLAAGTQLRLIFRKFTKNKYLGVISGFLSTVLIQSSSATTVLCVSFVSAGLISLTESAGVMLGANVGTTITGWLVSIFGFHFNVFAYLMPLLALGVPLYLGAKSKLKYWGQFIVGFVFLFMGLNLLREAVPPISENHELLKYLSNFAEWGLFSGFIFILIGALMTMIMQSSSASMAITITMCAEGWLPFDLAIYMIMGENIGTTITAEIAALVASVRAKRTARIHTLFNVIGVSWMILLMPFIVPIFEQLNFSWLLGAGQNPMDYPANESLSLAAFHTFFNIVNVLILLPFVSQLIKLATYTVKDRSTFETPDRLKYINNPALSPELILDAVNKEVAHFGDIVSRMNIFLTTIVNSSDKKEKKESIKKIQKYEKITDVIEIEIRDYIAKISMHELTNESADKLRSYVNIATNLERIGDIYADLSTLLTEKIKSNIYFLPDQLHGIRKMLLFLESAFKEMKNNINKQYVDKNTVAKAIEIEQSINELRNQLSEKNLVRLGDEEYSTKSALIYSSMFNALERIGDHVTNVSKSLQTK